MRFSGLDDTDNASAFSVSLDSDTVFVAGPSSFDGDTGPPSPADGSERNVGLLGNGHLKVSNGSGTEDGHFLSGSATTNGASSSSSLLKQALVNGGSMGKGASTAPAISRVNLPGTRLYPDSYIDREEFVRLVVQSLRDVGYM